MKNETGTRVVLALAVAIGLGGAAAAGKDRAGALPTTWPGDTADVPAAQCEPLIRGVLWWVNPDRDGPKVKETIDAMAAAGMNLLWIIGSNEFLTQENNPMLRQVFDEADRRGWRVILATSSNGRWYYDWDIPALKKIEDRNIPLIARRYGQRPSFFGWYINYEIYTEWGEHCHRIRELFIHIGAVVHEVTPKAKLVISPFYLADKDQIQGKFRYAEPEEYAMFWAETIRQAGINIVMLQDSGELHCACVPVSTRITFFEMMRAACKANNAELWGNVETVEIPSPNMTDYARRIEEYRRGPWSFDMARNAFKLDLASRYCTNIVSWGWEFWNPVFPQTKVGNSSDNYAAYKAYYEGVKRRLAGPGEKSASPRR